MSVTVYSKSVHSTLVILHFAVSKLHFLKWSECFWVESGGDS